MAGREIVNRQVNIYIQSGDAQKALDVLLGKQKKLTEEIKQTSDPKRMKQLQADLAKLSEPIDRATKKLSGELNPSLKDTAASVQKLKNQLSRMSDGDEGFGKMTQQLRQGNKELDQQRSKVGLISKAWKSFWSEAKTVAAGVIIGNTIQSALQTVLGYFTGIITGSAKIADELSDIEKTTGLTNAQVRELNKELGKIDTRTSRSELRKLAAEGGKLGFETTAELLKFVDAADKIKVALKEDLGEEAILDIAKTSKVFQVEMLNMASAINEVGASSSASEAFSVDFLKRTGGVAATVKIAAGDVLGYSSAIEQAGLTAEVSTTALNTFFIDFVSNAEKFGKAAGFAKGELTKLIQEKGTNEGFLQFLERLKAANPTASAFINKLKDLGIDGARGSNVMLTLANNIGEVREQQLIANKAIASSDSIMNEFDKKNTNAAANLDKLRKEIAGLFQSESFQRAGEAVISIMRRFITALKNIPEFLRENKFALLTLVGGIILLNRAYLSAGASSIIFRGLKIAEIAVTKVATLVLNIQKAAIVAHLIVTEVLAKRLAAVRGAQLLWSAAMSAGAGPIGILLVSVGALVIGLGKLFSKTKQLTAEQKIQAELAEKVNEATGQQVAQVEVLLKVLQDTTTSLDNKKKALEALIKINPDFAKTLSINANGELQGAEAVNIYIKALKTKAEAEAKYALLLDKTKQKNDRFNEIRQKTGFTNATDAQIEAEIKRLATQRTDIFSGENKIVFKAIAKDMQGLLDQINILQKDIATTSIDAVTTAGTTVTGVVEAVDDAVTKTDGAAKKTKNTLADLLKDLEKIKNDLRLSQLTPFEKEMAELDLKFNALRERAGKNIKLLLVIEELHQQSRLQLIQEYARREVEAWSKAGEDVNKKADEQFKKNLEAMKGIQKRLDDEVEKQLLGRDRNRLAGRELDVLKASGKAKLKAELELLNEQKRQELQVKDLTENEKLLIEEKYRIKRMQAEMGYISQLISDTVFFLQGAADIDRIFSDARTKRENAELESNRRLNESKKNNLDRRLKLGIITQLQYDREVQKIEKEQERREKVARKKQFERDKRAQFIAAIISNAGAVSTTLQKFGPPIAPNFLGIAAMALTVITGLAQIGTIAGSKAPEFGKGGKLGGQYHSQGGNPILDGNGRKIGEIEREEGIINRFSMGDKRKYTVTGSPSQIASKINSLHGGVHWESGATLRPAWANARPMPMNFNAIHRYYASGGKFESSESSNSSQTSNTAMQGTLELLATVVFELKEQMKKPIKSYTILSEHEIAVDRMAAIREDATMR